MNGSTKTSLEAYRAHKVFNRENVAEEENLPQHSARPGRRRTWGLRMAWWLGAGTLVLLVASITLGAWYILPPPPGRYELAPGIFHECQVDSLPRARVIHWVSVDLTNPRIDFLVTPASSLTPHFAARTTLDFLRQHDLLLAINGDLFSPQHVEWPWDYRPRSHELVVTCGPSICRHETTHPPKIGYFAAMGCTLYITRDRQVSFGQAIPNAYMAISGGPFLTRGGKRAPHLDDQKLHPQSAVGHDPVAKKLWFVVVDGRQPGYSAGSTDSELADLLLEKGCADSLRFDGGGSATLVAHSGGPRVLNRPIHAGIPGWQRPVANHLGVRLHATADP